MIGTVSEARILFEARRCSGGRPKGWKYLASGCYRTVYLSPSGVVYKCETGANGANRREYENYVKLLSRKLPEGVRLPRLTYFREYGIIAMEAFEDTLADAPYDARYDRIHGEMRRQIPIKDLHTYNVMIDRKGEMLVPVDLGEYGDDTDYY